MRSSCAVTSCGVPTVAIVVKSCSDTSPLRKCIGRTGTAPPSAATSFKTARTPRYAVSRELGRAECRFPPHRCKAGGEQQRAGRSPYTTVGGDVLWETSVIATVLAVFCLISVVIWAGFGTVIGRFLANPRAHRVQLVDGRPAAALAHTSALVTPPNPMPVRRLRSGDRQCRDQIGPLDGERLRNLTAQGKSRSVAKGNFQML